MDFHLKSIKVRMEVFWGGGAEKMISMELCLTLCFSITLMRSVSLY